MRNDKKNNFRKEEICYFEIFLMILSIFAFSFIMYQSNNLELKSQENNKETLLAKFLNAWLARSKINLVSASVYNCCPVLRNSSISCQDLSAETCSSQCAVACLPTTCNYAPSCQLGCCFDSEEGTCARNTPKILCQQEGGAWKNDAVCNTPECQLGCCVLGANTDFVTERRCQYLSSLNGFALDFRKEANNELSCLILSNQQSVGACVISQENKNSCRFLSKVECLKLQGNFNEGLLCSASSLNTTCSRTSETKCVEGKDEVYFLDSCGNTANIYDSRKINDENYWSHIISKEDSCNSNSGNINSQSCGNCNYFLGSKCSSSNKKNICIDLNCKNAPDMVDAFGNILGTQDRKNGESWCVYDSAIGQGKDAVGSRHWRYFCIDGKVQIEACEDFRQGICVESEVTGEGGSMSFASCRPNRWRECLNYNNLADSGKSFSSSSSKSSSGKSSSSITGNSILGIFGGGDDSSSGAGESVNFKKVIEKCNANSDCYLKKFNFGIGYDFVKCLPAYPSGFMLQARDVSELDKGGTCAQANFECKRIEISGALGGTRCVAGCECGTAEWVQQMNDWCASLGDCGAYVNINGQVTDDGYLAEGSEQININQYAKYASPVRGQRANPGNITELIGMISPGNAEDYPSEGMPIKSIPALILAQVGKGAAAGLISWGITATVARGGTYAYGTFGNLFARGALTTGAESATGIVQGQVITVSELTPLGSGLAGAASAGMGALAGAAVGTAIAMMFGLEGADAYSAGCMVGSISGIVGLASTGALGSAAAWVANAPITLLLGPQTFASLGIFGPVAAVIPWAIIAAIVISMMFGPTEGPSEKIYEFKCMQWQAPVGGDDCEKCNNDLKPCSRYRCSSLGQNCELLNEGTGNELGVKRENDNLYPQIKPWEDIVTKGYKYSNIQQDSFKLLQESNECIQEFKPVVFGILTNEPAQCKLAINRTTKYDDMNYYFGDSNLYSYNHSIAFNFPSVDSVVSGLGLNGTDAARLSMQLTQKKGDLNLYVRCRDKNGNYNQKEYVIKTCVRAGPDLTPPAINSAVPKSGSYFAHDSSSQLSTFYLSEPSDCRYSKANLNYENMISNMSCSYRIFSPACSATFTNLSLSLSNKFYIKCKDQPWLGSSNNSRNIMKESYVYELKPSSSELEIYDPEPNGTIKSGIEPISITLKVKTRGGADGTSRCSWQINDWQDEFALTNSNVHESYLSMMMAGDYHVIVNCEDAAGNTASKEWDFSLDLDSQGPKITRVYNAGTLKIVTNEKAECRFDLKACNFNWENSTRFQTADGLVHNVAWEAGLSYYIKCKDDWGNSNECFIARTY